MKNLPRYDGKIKSNMIVVSRRLSQNEIGDAIVWTVEELNGPWNLTTDGFCFEDENEAMLFKLRWG